MQRLFGRVLKVQRVFAGPVGQGRRGAGGEGVGAPPSGLQSHRADLQQKHQQKLVRLKAAC